MNSSNINNRSSSSSSSTSRPSRRRPHSPERPNDPDAQPRSRRRIQPPLPQTPPPTRRAVLTPTSILLIRPINPALETPEERLRLYNRITTLFSPQLFEAHIAFQQIQTTICTSDLNTNSTFYRFFIHSLCAHLFNPRIVKTDTSRNFVRQILNHIAEQHSTGLTVDTLHYILFHLMALIPHIETEVIMTINATIASIVLNNIHIPSVREAVRRYNQAERLRLLALLEETNPLTQDQ